MDAQYRIEADKINKQLQKYRVDITMLFRESPNVAKDLVKYVINVLKEENNPEIGRIVVEVAFAQNAALLTILKVLVKILYVVKHITKYKYGDYYRLKKYIDEAIVAVGGIKAEVAKRKYEILLEKIMKEDIKVHLPKDKDEVVSSIRDTINKNYIKFV